MTVPRRRVHRKPIPSPMQTPVHIPSTLKSSIRRQLLNWYDRQAVDLPWRRRQHDPYAQWVAEIMLQQTRVDTVVHYYDRFLKRFPTIESLARAKHDRVLKYWEGLGYYRRILHLHRAVQQLHSQRRNIPDNAPELRELSGVGEYTAAAIASIAFGQREAAVDGNVARVLSRLMGMKQNVQAKPGRSIIDQYAKQLIPVKRPGDFNQAWMDLGRTICTPKSPKCDVCPLKSNCLSAGTEFAASLPVRHEKKSKSVPQVSYVVGIFVCEDRMLTRRRPTGGLWSGLWEFPNLECKRNSNRTDLCRQIAKSEGVLLVGQPKKSARVTHQLTHRSLTFHVYVCRAKSDIKPATRTNRQWSTLSQFKQQSVSTAHRKIFSVVSDVI